MTVLPGSMMIIIWGLPLSNAGSVHLAESFSICFALPPHLQISGISWISLEAWTPEHQGDIKLKGVSQVGKLCGGNVWRPHTPSSRTKQSIPCDPGRPIVPKGPGFPLMPNGPPGPGGPGGPSKPGRPGSPYAPFLPGRPGFPSKPGNQRRSDSCSFPLTWVINKIHGVDSGIITE